MDKEHLKGEVDQIAGKTKEVIGRTLGDQKLEEEGKADRARGAVHKAVGDAKDAGEEAVNAVRNAPSRQ